MEGDIDSIEMLQKKQKEEKSTFKKWLKKWIKKIVESRTFLAILMLTIGISWTVVYYEGRELYRTAQTLFASRTMTFVNPVLAAEMPKIEETKPIEKESYQIATIKKISKENNIDWKLVYAVCLKESGCNPSINCDVQFGKCDNGLSFGAYQIYNPTLDPERKKMAQNFEQATLWTIQHGAKYKDNPELFFKNHNGIAKTTNQWYVDGAMQIYKNI